MSSGGWILLVPSRRHPRGDLALIVGVCRDSRLVVRRWRETKGRLGARELRHGRDVLGRADGDERLEAARAAANAGRDLVNAEG